MNDVHQFGFNFFTLLAHDVHFVLKILLTIMSKMVAMYFVVLLTLLRHSTTSTIGYQFPSYLKVVLKSHSGCVLTC